MTRKPELRIGTSGWQYGHWLGVFYPDDVPKKRWLEYYAERFDTVEVNNTFYNLPRAETFDSWRERAPDNFLYALKFNRYGSHIMHLKNPGATIGKFLERAERLRGHLGPILVQLPPQWKADAERLDDFLAAAPKRHDWAVEFRNESWLTDDVMNILKKHNAALCIHDNIENHPRIVTAGFVYLRFHHGTLTSGYTKRALGGWAVQIEKYQADGMSVYAYFNNDVRGNAIKNAITLREMLGVPAPTPAPALSASER